MALVVQVIGLGGCKQNAIDPGTKKAAQDRAAADAEAIENARQRGFEIVQRFRPGIEGCERIDQHDLAVEAGKMVAEERTHHDILVGLVTPAHHRPQRAVGRAAVGRDIERRKGQRRRACEIARHQEAPGRQQAHCKTFVAAGAQIIGEQFRRGECRLFVLAALCIKRLQMLVPRRGELCARTLARQGEALGRPLLKTLAEQRQIQQPLAGVIDDVDGKRAVGAILPLVVNDEAQFADIRGRTRPAPLLDQGADMVLIIEARHRIVRLRLQPGAGDSAGGIGLEDGKPAAAGQAVDQCRDEHGLAGARQACDAEPHGGIEKAVAVVQQRPRRQARFLDDI